MVWDNDYDVKEYRPKKRDIVIPFPKNAASSAAELRLRDSVTDRDGGVMLTTSEILDFSEGSDSYV